MQSGRLIKSFLCILLLMLSAACSNIISSAVESGIVYVVAKHDETVEKKQKKYTATDRCVVKGYPDAFALADAIVYGQPLTEKYDRILSRTGEDIDPVQPHQLAYALYIIANEIHDKRAKERLAWMEKQIKPEEAMEIKSIIDDKYLNSHLEKCFTVPDEYKIEKTTRELIKEEQIELERKNNKVLK